MADKRLKPVDVVIVGAGLVGTIVAKELAATGLKIVGLERGRMLDPQHDFTMPYVHDELKAERANETMQNFSRETVTFRNDMSELALPLRELGSFKPGECVGGAAMHWAGVAQRFLPWDFEAYSRTVERYGRKHLADDCTTQDWGVTYEELEAYYDQFEHIYGVGGKAGNLNGELQRGGNPYEGSRSREYPNPPKPMTYVGALFNEAAESLGYKPFPMPTAAMTRQYTNLYKVTLGACMNGGFCLGYGCAMGAKAGPISAVLPALLKHSNYELRTHANVTRIKLDSDGKRAVGVTYIDARGQEVEQPADLVILSSWVFNNVRLLLLSGIGQPYDPVAGTGVVGRNYSYVTYGHVRVFFEDKVFNRFMGGGGLGMIVDEFNGDHFDHTGLGFIGGASLMASSLGNPPLRSHPAPHDTPNWGSDWKKAVAHYYNRSFQLLVHGGCQSYRTNYLDLDPTYRDANGLPLLRMTFDRRDSEFWMSAWTSERAAEVARAMAPSEMDVVPVKGKYTVVPYQSTHNAGGAVMGADLSTSVVNKYLQSWDVPNVFVIGASAFPQNSANGPSDTVGALACWTADAIKDEYLKRPGPLL